MKTGGLYCPPPTQGAARTVYSFSAWLALSALALLFLNRICIVTTNSIEIIWRYREKSGGAGPCVCVH